VTPRWDPVTDGAVLYVPPASHSGPCAHAVWQRGLHTTVGRRMPMPLSVMEARFFVPRARDSRFIEPRVRDREPRRDSDSRSDGPRVDP
jgi:hypothetical protein